jgi:hypothetical protein
MLKFLAAYIAAAMAITALGFWYVDRGNEEAQLVLEEPEYEWVRPSSEGTELCLTGPDFMKHQMFMEGLKHEAGKGG